MDRRFRALLACPACGATLDPDWLCRGCDATYTVEHGIPALRLPGNERTERVRQFYSQAPFPGYPANADLNWLRARAERSRFARLLDEAIPTGALVLEVGCGTGQMSLYLARSDRLVIAADMTRASLLLGAGAAQRFGMDGVHFVETDLARPGLRTGVFDVVYCSGVLHHTPDPRMAFAQIVKLAKPGGTIVIGLYHAMARLPLRLRRAIAQITREKWIPGDPVLSDRTAEPERHEAWLRDQYRHPEEHRHTLGEVRWWFRENDVEYVRTFPSALLTDGEAGLFVSEGDGWFLEEWLAQIGWVWTLGGEGGLFVIVGRRAG
jgi:2-polyprenyl-3-methyl-5-hydroxy-6-metoxy-1,4-benzoquinol methylase/uncharacterized protein YbaR (Trm112 family)